MVKFKPAPGIIIAQQIEDSNKNTITITSKSDSHLNKGKVIAMGGDLTTPMGNIIKANKYCKVGDIIYFLSYEGNYDNTTINGKKYFAIKFEDMRFSI
jgi:co-chaperonin GroES (HSP10)